MLVRVSEIPEEGLQIKGASSFSRPFLDPAWRLDDVVLRVEKEGPTVLVRGRLAARVPLICGRCLDPFQVMVEPVVDARFVPNPSGREEESELEAEALETDVYARDVLDLTVVLETETTLGLPMKPLCRETCRGLCPICGGNRNVTSCACEERRPDPRWVPLKGWAERLSK